MLVHLVKRCNSDSSPQKRSDSTAMMSSATQGQSGSVPVKVVVVVLVDFAYVAISPEFHSISSSSLPHLLYLIFSTTLKRDNEVHNKII